MAHHDTDFFLSLEELTGIEEGDPKDAPTPMVAGIQRSWKRPMNELANSEIGDLVVQHYGYPFLLDLVWPKLEADPLFDGGRYPGDVLSMLIGADPDIWRDRPDYEVGLGSLYHRALARPEDENDAFVEALRLPSSRSKH